ncbi:hypothetical protein OSB04_000351 [Centaurea solstitialis]|uniref:Uncharacterized protein n=1 Tax=Centaurea solstitialis TaxID=347529 RepID=A0AA38U0M4_9ASTR|nr:hypothetical protein OSB04_000351 [Centaurea solstitialis]
MENVSRSFSRSYSSSVSSSTDTNGLRRRTKNGGYDGSKSTKTVRLGEENHGRFGKIKKLFNFNSSKKLFNFNISKKHEKDTSNIVCPEDDFQSRILFEIYKNMLWRRTTDGGYDDNRCMKTVRLGQDNHGRFWKIKKLFNFNGSKKNGKDTSKIVYSQDHFQSRLLFEIYKNMSFNHKLGTV